jgi:hypothetical protein
MKMFLIQLLLPLYDNRGEAFSKVYFDDVRNALTERFGGVTAFLQSPALGLWKESQDKVSRDEVVMFEVMASELDEEWWKEYRSSLEARFKQQELVVRGLAVIKL